MTTETQRPRRNRRWQLPLLATAILAVTPSAAGPASLGQPSSPEAASPAPLSRLALLPVQNRSDAEAPLDAIRRDLARRIELTGISVVEERELEAFMRRHRMRYVGGIHGALSAALRAEVGADAVLITSLDLYRETRIPKAALTCRLVRTGPDPQILWMDSAVEAGDASPGFLGLGLVTEIEVVLETVLDRIADSFHRRGQDPQPGRLRRPEGRLRPKIAFGAPEAAPLGGPQARIVVLPLANASNVPYAGDIVTDQLIRQMVHSGLNVVEPGAVRQILLETRQIQPRGPSVPQAELLHAIMDTDRIVFGEVGEYREAGEGVLDPVVGFTLRTIDSTSQQVIWSSISHTRGNEKVFFFDAGRIDTAHDLAARMAGALVTECRLQARRHGDS